MTVRLVRAARLFDGAGLHSNCAVRIEDGRITCVGPAGDLPAGIEVIDCPDGIVAPGFVDLQVNGGGGLMVDGEADIEQLAHICAAHRAMGTAAILPTLISDRADATRRVIAAGIDAAKARIPGFLGLHLEGPHLDPRRHGAHDPGHLRPMDDDDLAHLCAAACALPVLMVTLAPEAASRDQIAALARAGAIVSLGHSDCDSDTARAAFAAGAGCATHLFNAMSPLGHRAPGLTGAVLAGTAAAGLIADGIHVHPDAMRIALAARPTGLFLVTDCMATAGTEMDSFTLNGRQILCRDGALRLGEDGPGGGTLAGADLRMDRAIGTLVGAAGCPPARALAMSTSIPADLVGAGDRLGRIAPGRAADLVWLADDFSLRGVWSEDSFHPPQRDGQSTRLPPLAARAATG